MRIFSQPRAEAKIPSVFRPLYVGRPKKETMFRNNAAFSSTRGNRTRLKQECSFQQKAGYYHVERPGAGPNPFALADVGQKTCRQQLEATNW